jgi:hypothetical protein
MKTKTATTEFLRHISTDGVVFGYDDGKLKVLLRRESIERDGEISTEWKLPGHHIRLNETIEETAVRTLYEQTGLRNIFLKQFHVFSSLDRLRRREFDFTWILNHGVGEWRVITIGFYALVDMTKINLAEMSPQAEWRDISEIGELIFDHREILDTAFEKLRRDLPYEPVIFELLPGKFTLTELQNLYELIMGYAVDRRNFRRKAISKPYIVPLAEMQKGVAHRAAGYYMFNHKLMVENPVGKREDLLF